MSLLSKLDLKPLSTNEETKLRNKIIERYERFGEKRNEKGEVVQEGANFLQGISDPNIKTNVAVLMENQLKYLLNEATDTNSSGAFQHVAFPMVRRVMSKLLLNDIASVQAITRPSSTIYYYYPNISDRNTVDRDGTPYEEHTSPHARSLAKCVGANCPDTVFNQCQSIYTRYYDDRLFDHSRGAFTIIAATGTPIAIDQNGCYVETTGVVLSSDNSIRSIGMGVRGFDGNLSVSNPNQRARLNKGMGFEIDNEQFLASFMVINVGAPIVDQFGGVIYDTGDEVRWRPFAQRYGYAMVDYTDFCDENGVFAVEIDFRHPLQECDQCVTPDNFIGAASGTVFPADQFAFTWRRYDDLEFETQMGEVTFELKKTEISVIDRKLRARWSPELAYDVSQFHNINAEAELTALMSEQIAMEIDREGLLRLKKGAAWVDNWNFNGWRYPNTSVKYTEKEWKQTFVTKVNQISAQIHKATLRGGANFLVVSTEISALLDDLSMFMVSANRPEDDKYNLGMKRVGTLSGRYTVYVDPYSKANHCLIGHKGSSILDTGFIFAPYLVAQLTPTLQDPNNFTNVKGISSRYAMKMVNNAYYGLVNVINIPTFDVKELR
jgi:hypothetical protein